MNELQIYLPPISPIFVGCIRKETQSLKEFLNF